MREARSQIGEPLGPEQQLADDHQGPTLAYTVERAGYSARVAVCA